MVVYYDPIKNQTIDTEAGPLAQEERRMPIGLDPIGQKRWEAEEDVRQQQLAYAEGTKEGRNKPLFAQSGGEFFEDLGNILGDTATGLVTDYMDLGAGLADIAIQTGNAITGRGFDGDQVFDDSDNPWTKWRQQEFGTKTEAGAVVANVSRLASMVLTLPKIGIKGLALAPRILSKAPKVGAPFGATANWLEKLDETVKASRNVKVTEAMTDLGKGFAQGSAAGKATEIAAADDWLSATFKEVSQVGEAKTWWNSVQDSTKALTQLSREKGRIRTVSEALAWDAFAAFNVYGEGDWQMDETFTDMLAEAGVPGLPWLQTGVQDTPLMRKFKQMTEGLVMGGALNAAFDMARVYRYSRAFASAGPEEQAQIVKAFNADAEEIGRGIAGLLPDRAAPHPDIAAAAAKEARLEQLKLGVNTERIGQQYQRDLDVAQLMANQQTVGQAQELLPGSTPAGLLPQGEPLPQGQLPGAPTPGQLPGAPEQAMLPPGSSPEPKPPGQPTAGVLGAGGELAPVTPGMQPVQVTDLGPRPPEPTVTPQTIRSAYEADAFKAFKQAQELTFQEGPDGVMRSVSELRQSVKQLLPRTRVDSIEYMTKFTPQANELGVVNASDSVWMNFITNRGLAEGWATIDPDSFEVKFNRKAAFEIDRGDVAAKQAAAFDELAELNRYEEWLWNKELVNGSPQMRPEVQDNLAQKEARDLYDNWEADQAAQAPDNARLDLERKAVTAGVEEDQMLAAEELRLSQAELDKAMGKTDDATVVREFLGTTLDEIRAPEVQKAETGRGWEVIGADGEILGTTTTKRAADKMAEAERRRMVDSTIARARQMEQDGTDQAVNVAIGNPVYDSDIVGKVTLTDSQIDAVQKFSTGIQSQMNADWAKRTGGQAFININELGKAKKTFELTQGEMLDLVDGIKALLQTGEITGSRAKVLKNVADKLDTSMKLLAPQARAKRFADGIVADTQRFLEHGDFC